MASRYRIMIIFVAGDHTLRRAGAAAVPWNYGISVVGPYGVSRDRRPGPASANSGASGSGASRPRSSCWWPGGRRTGSRRL